MVPNKATVKIKKKWNSYSNSFLFVLDWYLEILVSRFLPTIDLSRSIWQDVIATIEEKKEQKSSTSLDMYVHSVSKYKNQLIEKKNNKFLTDDV